MKGIKLRGKTLSIIAAAAGIAILFVGVSWADIPAPPVNQSTGFYDTIFNNLVEAECRVCHDDPGIVGPAPNVDRHHLLYGTPLQQGQCSVNNNICLSDADCIPDICEFSGDTCTIDSDCPNNEFGETCGEACVGESAVFDTDANQDGVNDTTYGCMSCHEQDTSGGFIKFIVKRDCLQCHVQVPGEASVHHLTATAKGTLPPEQNIGDDNVGDCTPCHGTLVDDIGDGHQIPTYNPSLVTPNPHGGGGEPLNSEGNGAGACNYCHDDGTDNATGVQVFTNADNHHNAGISKSLTGGTDDSKCFWCHNWFQPQEYAIRTCEGCHGLESLHNIQLDSDGSGDIVVGGELPGYGHVGADDPGAGSDCWGCHGFSLSSATAVGSTITPFIAASSISVMTTGTNTEVILSGSAFTNIAGAVQWTSNAVLTSPDGSSVVLAPDDITQVTQGSLKVTIPGSTVPGNYTLQAVKGDAASNPIAMSIKPSVAIISTMCKACLGILTISGSGFGETPPEGAQDYINVEQDGIKLNIVSWTDTQIKASGANCNFDSVTVNSLFDSATWNQ